MSEKTVKIPESIITKIAIGVVLAWIPTHDAITSLSPKKEQQVPITEHVALMTKVDGQTRDIAEMKRDMHDLNNQFNRLIISLDGAIPHHQPLLDMISTNNPRRSVTQNNKQ